MFGWKSAERKTPRRMMDATGAYDGGATGVMTGIVGTTRVATSMGWREVSALQAGDMVLTFDGGLQRVAKVTRRALWTGEGRCPERFWPLLVPAGAIDNAVPMLVLPRQGVMLESDIAEAVLGDPFALIPAAALEGVRGVERVYPNDPIEVVILNFEADQVIFAEHGALLFCPAGGDLFQMALQGAARLCPYEMLPETCAVELALSADARAECHSCLEALRAFRDERAAGFMAVA